ncbi:pyruvate dehydrogenase complex E1 component subunit beta [Alphaproteobacteria bacterium]|jgi:pyruvate dehydrogenase E1 component beta subunit|nr:pyruvate dehydrogenase complex E1 component subunit beta [Alphaproteobacteria bacterium]MDB3864061.1 pyruvate dehydrogenase complex E1 component subunit beta [Alphaproteobacteria bacterium]
MKILLPALSPTMETGNLVKWLVEEGQKVNSGDLIAEIETDKATMELEAPDDGTINQLVVSEGTENIKVNSLIAILDVEGEDLENDVTPSDEIVTKEQPKKEVDSSISMNSIINSSEENNSNWTEVEITMREALNQAIVEEMNRDKDVFLLGEEVAEYNGAYKVTQGLLDKFGKKRVLDTPISEHGFTGLAIGAAMAGLKPICEFMTFNFSMQAIDQIINSAAKSLYMSGGEINVPIVFRGPNGAAARVAAQHSQCFISWFSHIPGLLVVAPSNARDAKGLLKSSIRNPNPVIFLEHELLYKEKMMVPEEDEFVIPLGKGKMISEGDDVTIIGFSMSVHKILNALPDIKSLNINADIIDLRSIKPLDEDLIYKSVKKTNRVVIVEDGWGNTSFGSHLSYLIQSNCFDYLDSEIIKVSGKDVPMPYAENLESLALPTKDEIVSAVKKVTYKN